MNRDQNLVVSAIRRRQLLDSPRYHIANMYHLIVRYLEDEPSGVNTTAATSGYAPGPPQWVATAQSSQCCCLRHIRLDPPTEQPGLNVCIMKERVQNTAGLNQAQNPDRYISSPKIPNEVEAVQNPTVGWVQQCIVRIDCPPRITKTSTIDQRSIHLLLPVPLRRRLQTLIFQRPVCPGAVWVAWIIDPHQVMFRRKLLGDT